jgi:regulator of nucleoside diphosphate kinase
MVCAAIRNWAIGAFCIAEKGFVHMIFIGLTVAFYLLIVTAEQILDFNAGKSCLTEKISQKISSKVRRLIMSATRTIYITKFDMDRLLELIDGVRSTPKYNRANVDLLEKELCNAKIVDSVDVPNDVITMNSEVNITDVESGEQMTYTLVFPAEANIAENKLSILVPLGMALIGYRKGDVIEWPVPSGVRKIRVNKIIYQPEAAGHYNL